MAVAYESKTGVTLGLNATPQNVTLPSGTAEGELLLVHWTQIGASGATAVFDITGSLSLVTAYMYHNSDGYHASGLKYRYATSSDITNGYIQVWGSDSASITARINVYRISGEIAALAASGADVSADTTPVYAVPLTPIAANNLLIFLSATSESTGTPNGSDYAIVTDNPTWTEITDEREENMGGNTDDPCVFMAHATRTETTSTGNASMTLAFGDTSFGILVAISPATSVTATPAVTTGTLTVPTPTVAGGANMTPTFTAMTASAPTITTTTPAETWTNQSKNSANWTNQSKS